MAGSHKQHFESRRQIVVQLRIHHINKFIATYYNTVIQIIRDTDRLRTRSADRRNLKSVSYQQVLNCFTVIQFR